MYQMLRIQSIIFFIIPLLRNLKITEKQVGEIQ